MTGIADGRIAGWARDAGEPSRSVQVEFWLGNRLLGQATADAAGHHGFAFAPDRIGPAEFPATLFARIVGADLPLDGRLVIRTQEELARLLPAPVRPDNADPPDSNALDRVRREIHDLGDRLGTALVRRLEAHLTIFRDETEREIQALRRTVEALGARLDAPAAPKPRRRPAAGKGK
jgi:hypothetical protein